MFPSNDVNQNYDPSQTCYGDVKGKEYTCYNTSSSRDYPVGRMNTYLNTTAASAPPATGGLWMMQGIWQESAETVAIGEVHGSTLLEDESRSQLNAIITANVAKGVYSNIYMQI